MSRLLLARRAEKRDLTVGQFLALLQRYAPNDVATRFYEAFAREPALLAAVREASRVGKDQTAAGDLVRSFERMPEFRRVISRLAAEPGCREAYEAMKSDPALARAFRGEVSEGSASRRSAGLGPHAAGPGAHGVSTALAAPASELGESAASSYFPSPFASMPPQALHDLEDACDRWNFCDPVAACQVTGLWAECSAACRAGGRCPEVLLQEEEPDIPIPYRPGAE